MAEVRLYHFTDERGVHGIQAKGFVGSNGRSSFYSAWPSDDLQPQGSSDCTWVVTVDIPIDLVAPDRSNPDLICTVSDEALNARRDSFQYQPVPQEQRRRWGF
jgi:hypothetical protein